MHPYQKQFIKFALEKNVLRFGEFTLKSGRISPYFFNAGLFNTGLALHKLGEFYAAAIKNNGIKYDMLFGPAYKGIPLAVTTALALATQHQKDVPYCFNRKEAKDHGEGGNIVGAALQGKVLIIDDVITAGTATREAMTILNAHQAKPVGVVIAMDRQERGQGATSAIQEVEAEFNIPVISIIKLEHLLAYLALDNANEQILQKVRQYRQEYAV